MKKLTFSLTSRLVIMTLILLGFGLIMIYSASVAEGARDFDNKWYFVLRQLRWAGVGLVAMFGISLIPPKFFARAAPLILGLGLFLLLVVLIPGIGTRAQGARRWIVLAGIVIQPSELIKWVEIVYLSSWLHARRITLVQFGVLLATIAGLIMLQPDMGTTLVVTLIALAVYFLAGYPLIHLIALGLAGSVAAVIMIVSATYRLERVKTFLNPLHDTQGSSYHMRQVILSLGSGGIVGQGIGRSRQKYAYLPEATTDSIFAVVGEELGFIGGVGLILAFIYYLSLIFKIAAAERDPFASTMVGGVGAWIALQVCLNLAAMVALTPLTGVPLPLVSYGGSALVTMLAGIGLVLSVSRHTRI